MSKPELDDFMSSHYKWISLAIRIRAFEEVLLEQYGKGGIRGTVHTSLGQELIAVACAKTISDHDLIFGTHRSHAYFLALTEDFGGLASEILGRVGAVSKGIGGSQHIRCHNLITNGVQGGMTPIAVGASFETLDDWRTSKAVCVIGDGTMGSGVFYESLNVASLFSTNTIFLIENNGIAQSTPQVQFLAGSIKARSEAFSISHYLIRSNNPQEILIDFPKLVSKEIKAPLLVEVVCNRLGPHSKGDDNRPEEDLNRIKQEDLLNCFMFKNKSLADLKTQYVEEFSLLFEEIRNRPSIREFPRDYLSGAFIEDSRSQEFSSDSKVNLRDLTATRIDVVFSKYPKAILFGEDVHPFSISKDKPYGGAFGVSKKISEKWSSRLCNFPISEAALSGFGIGRALRGNPTLVEIMFGDFSTLIVDSIIQQASKIPSMYGDRIDLPIIYRIPSGGRRGYGPTHSQNLENLFFGIPNICVFVASSLDVSENIYADLLALKLPVIAIEPKDLYTKPLGNQKLIGYHFSNGSSDISLPYSFVPEIPSAGTIFTYGNAFEYCRELAQNLLINSEMAFDIFIARTLNPINLVELVSSLRKTRLLIIVEETNESQGVTSLLISKLKEYLDCSFKVVSIGGTGIIGASDFAESYALLNLERLSETIQKAVRS